MATQTFSAEGKKSSTSNQVYKEYVEWWNSNPTKRSGSAPMSYKVWKEWVKKNGKMNADGTFSIIGYIIDAPETEGEFAADSQASFSQANGTSFSADTQPTGAAASTGMPTPTPVDTAKTPTPAKPVTDNGLVAKIKRNKGMAIAVVLVIVASVYIYKTSKKKA